jgi:predicted porin
MRHDIRAGLLIPAAFWVFFAGAAQAADVPVYTKAPPVPSPPAVPAACKDAVDFFTTDCVLSYYGINVYGAIDLGAGYESHGARLNPDMMTGVGDSIRRNSNGALWTLVPNGLQQSNIGIRGVEPIAADLNFIFDLNFAFDPYTLSAANGPKSLLDNNGVPLGLQTSNGDAPRAGQFHNSAGYVGLSSKTFGDVTFGWQNSLEMDAAIAYDPMYAAYAFSMLGCQGFAVGGGDPESAKYTSVKYRASIGNLFWVAAQVQVGGYDLGNGNQSAYGLQVGKDFDLGAYGKLWLDAIYSNDKGAVAAALLSPAQNLLFPGTLGATISDNNSVMLLAKYAYQKIKLFAGFEFITLANPTSPVSATFAGIAGIPITFAPAAGTNNPLNQTNYTNPEHLQITWTGGRYSFTETVDAALAYYRYQQNSFGPVPCNTIASPKCSGSLNAVGFDVEWRAHKKLTLYAGFLYSEVRNGLASGYLNTTDFAPTVGLRFRW